MVHAELELYDGISEDLAEVKGDAYRLDDSPLDLPIGTLPKRPDGIGRAMPNPSESVAIQPAVEPKPDMRVRWMPAMMESLYYTGIMHAFRTVTEPGTRDTLNGHWFQNYAHSLGSLRGWTDADSFMARSVVHSI